MALYPDQDLRAAREGGKVSAVHAEVRELPRRPMDRLRPVFCQVFRVCRMESFQSAEVATHNRVDPTFI